MLQPPDFDHRRRVPIDVIYVPQMIEVIGGEQGLPSREIDLRTLAGEIDRTVLLGDPGGGKTTAANVLLHFFAGDSTRRIPFLVTLREFASADRSVVGYIEYRLETFYQCPAPPGLVDRLLLTGGAVVVFDGLDELIDTSRRAEMAAIVERFCTEYPHTRMLVTSRVVGYDEARLDERQFISSYKLGSFGNEQVAEYVRRWFFYEEDQYDHIDHYEAERSVNAFLDESENVPELRANPMLLSLMCILYKGEGSLPRDRPEVYAQCANLLFRKWDAHRRIHVPLRPSLRAPHLLEGTLRHLAWWLFTRDQAQSTATERQLIDETTRFLHSHRFESRYDAQEAASEFVEFSKGRMWVFSEMGTTAAGERLYSFTHRTFLEYFAAEYLAYSHPKLIEELARHVARGEWEVVAELAVQMKDRTSAGGAQRIYELLIPRYRPTWRGGHSVTLQFLARCLRSVAPPPGTVRELTREILDHLFFSVGNPDEPVWYLPLSWLLANCVNDKTVVHDEISKRIDGMVASGNPKTCLNGLRLAVWLPYSLSAGDVIGNRIFLKSRMRHFWLECAGEYTRAYSDAITKAAADEIWLRRAALTYGLITVDRALRMPGGLPALFLARGTGIFGMERMAYLPAAVIRLVTGRNDLNGPADPDGFAKVIAGFAAVGSYLTECSGPPWPTGPVDDWSEYLWKQPQESSAPRSSLDPLAYFGAAATLLIVAESLVITELRRKGREQFGPLSDLYPYIAHRWGIGANDELADLPVPERFRQLFRDWADNKVNFVGPAPDSTYE